MLAFGLFDRFELGVALPATLAQRSEQDDVDTGAALSDLRILPKLMLFEAGPLSFGIRVPFELPTGDRERFSGHPGLRVVPGLIVSVDAGRFGAALNAGYRWREDAVEVTTGDSTLVIDHEFVGSLGAHVELVENRFDIIADATFTAGLDEFDSEELWSELYLALRLWLGDYVAATLGGGPGLSEGPGTPAFRVFFGLGMIAPLAPKAPPPDRDGDGIPDDATSARHSPRTTTARTTTAAPIDRGQRRRRHPRRRRQVPGRARGQGRLPGRRRLPRSRQRRRRHPRRADDAARTSAEDNDGFQDEDGCPDPDNDGDGMLDAADKCPTRARDQERLPGRRRLPRRDPAKR